MGLYPSFTVLLFYGMVTFYGTPRAHSSTWEMSCNYTEMRWKCGGFHDDIMVLNPLFAADILIQEPYNSDGSNLSNSLMFVARELGSQVRHFHINLYSMIISWFTQIVSPSFESL